MLEHDTYATKRQIDTYRQKLMAEATNDRLMRQIGARPPSWQRRVLSDIGGVLIAVGKKLQEPYCLSTASKAKAR